MTCCKIGIHGEILLFFCGTKIQWSKSKLSFFHEISILIITCKWWRSALVSIVLLQIWQLLVTLLAVSERHWWFLTKISPQISHTWAFWTTVLVWTLWPDFICPANAWFVLKILLHFSQLYVLAFTWLAFTWLCNCHFLAKALGHFGHWWVLSEK